MAFHPKKCVVLNVTRNPTPAYHKYHLRDSILENVDTAPYLGVTLDRRLDWNAHINNTVSKASRTLNFVRRNLCVSTPLVKETAYQTLERPTLDYACTVWSPHLPGQKHKVEMVQHRAARFVTGRYHNTSSVATMLNDLQWETLEARRANFRIAMMFRIIHGYVAVPPDVYFHPSRGRTRQNHEHYILPQHAPTDYLKGTFFVATIPLWNALPSQIVSAPSLEAFKTRLATYQLNK